MGKFTAIEAVYELKTNLNTQDDYRWLEFTQKQWSNKKIIFRNLKKKMLNGNFVKSKPANLKTDRIDGKNSRPVQGMKELWKQEFWKTPDKDNNLLNVLKVNKMFYMYIKL